MAPSATDLEKAFDLGIAAYRKGDYGLAVSIFVRLAEQGSHTYWLKANMAIVQAYIAQKRWAEAKALCQTILQKTSMPTARKWIKATLTRIDHQASRQTATSSVATSNTTVTAVSGFEHDNKSGFRPTATDSQITISKPPVAKAASQLESVNTTFEPSNTSVDALDTSAPGDETPRPQVSMFHYTYLNREVTQADNKTESNCATQNCSWIYADRLDNGRSLGRIKQSQLWIAQLSSAIALYFLLRFLIQCAVAIFGGYLSFLDRILPFDVWLLPSRLEYITWPFLIVLLAIAIASPWLWDLYLHFYADCQKLSIAQLRTYSPESASVISQYCRQHQSNLPHLWKLSTSIPLLFSYGWLPRNARLVVSDGLLSILQEDELAALLAYELSFSKSWHWPLLTAHGLLLQVFHRIYWQLALWGNKQSPLIKWMAGMTASFSYTLFWLVRLPGLWLARVRTYYGDRFATEITGNPNGLIRGLTKLSFGLAAGIEQQGYTPAWIESLSLLMPVSADLSRQKLYSHLPLAALFAWDSKNPLRNWMSFLDPHPPLGDRLHMLTAYARYWKLTPEISFDYPPDKRSGLSQQDWKRLFNQGTPYCGLVLGLGVGTMLWGLGAIASALKWPILDWMYKDVGLFQCCLLVGTGVGILLRINRFFPDLPSFKQFPSSPEQFPSVLPGHLSSKHPILRWIAHSKLLPVDSLPVKLTGTLLGRPGTANWLGQDLCLKTSFGLIKLHFSPTFGPLGTLLTKANPFQVMQGKPVQITGWFRRGVHPWVDIHQIGLSDNKLFQAAHPLYSLLLVAVTTGLGLWCLLQSN